MNGRRCFVANDILYELVRTEAYRARFTVKRDGQKVELPDVQFDTWQDEDGQTHMTLGFTVYGIKNTAQCVKRSMEQYPVLRTHRVYLAGRPCART